MELNPATKIIDSTKLKAFAECPRKFMFEYIFGWRSEAPSNHLIFGLAWHEALEHLEKSSEYSIDVVSEAYEKFYSEYRKEFGHESDESFGAKNPGNAFVTLAKYAETYFDDPEKYTTIKTEIAGSVSISSEDVIYFRLDALKQNKKTGEYFVREHKTGSRTWLWADQWPLSIQIGTYSHAGHCLCAMKELGSFGGVEMNGTFFIKRKKDPYDFMRFVIKKPEGQMQNWLSMVRYYSRAIKDETKLMLAQQDNEVLEAFPQCPSSCLNYSRVCDYMDFCLAWRNPLSRTDMKPPPGFRQFFWNPMDKPANEIVEL